MPEHSPAKRGPGRPRKNPPSAPPPKSVAEFNPPDPPDPHESKVFDNKTVAANVIDALTAGGEPMTATEVAHLIDIPVAVVTTILDDLVSERVLFLNDFQRYGLIPQSNLEASAPDEDEAAIEQIKSAPEVTIDVKYDDSDPDNLKGNVQTVRIPTSDLFSFLTNINLPPQFLAGLGALHDISGFLSFEVVEPTPDDPRPVGKVHATIYGRHTPVVRQLNPNQPGYVSPVSFTNLTS